MRRLLASWRNSGDILHPKNLNQNKKTKILVRSRMLYSVAQLTFLARLIIDGEQISSVLNDDDAENCVSSNISHRFKIISASAGKPTTRWLTNVVDLDQILKLEKFFEITFQGKHFNINDVEKLNFLKYWLEGKRCLGHFGVGVVQ